MSHQSVSYESHNHAVVTWLLRNPWIDKAKATADFGDDEYMVRPMLHNLCQVAHGQSTVMVMLFACTPAAASSYVSMQEMVCVEPAIAPSGPVTLKPQKTWHGAQTIRHRLMGEDDD